MQFVSSRICLDGISAAVALAIGTALVIYGAYLLVLGPEWTVVLPDGPSTVTRDPSAVGVVPLVAGVVLAWGILRGSGRMTWLGTALALAFAVLFVFSMGGVLLPVVALLLVAAMLRFPPRDRLRSKFPTA